MADIPLIDGTFQGKDILSIDQFSSEDLPLLFKQAELMKDIAQHAKPSSLLAGSIVTLLFYEPSSRTFGSFSASVKQLGGQTIEIINPQEFSSVVKGETFEDTIRVFESYSDAIILRHTQKGEAIKAAQAATRVPIINAGDGVGEHPTQALLDLYTIYEHHNRLDTLTGVIAGDLLYGRTVHSLIKGLSLFKKNTLYLLSPQRLQLTRDDFALFSKKGIRLIEIEKETDIPHHADFWYWTRVQKERFEDISEYEAIKNRYIVTPTLLQKYASNNTILLHPLPRVGEITQEVDPDPRALYLRNQIRNGMYIRMALIALILGKIT